MNRILLFVLLAIMSTSCISRKNLTYLNNAELSNQTFFPLKRSEYRIQPNDILSIAIQSSNEDASKLFNSGGKMNNLNNGDLIFYLNGSSVDNQGNIEVPVIGLLKVTGLTVYDIKALIEERLSEYFEKEALLVVVQLSGIRFSVVGDVNNSGKYVAYQNQVNVFEALAYAGDITTIGDRTDVQIIRQTPEGIKIINLDLTSGEILSSSNYFIQPNDVINVKPLAVKSIGIGTTGFQTFASILGVLASTATLIFTLTRIE